MRHWILWTSLCFLAACGEQSAPPAATSASSRIERPAVERPPTGNRLPGDLKPPGR